MIVDPSSSVASLLALALALGVRHGVDADHLAAVDAIARGNASLRPGLARRAGVWFALGHGVVVMVAAALVAGAARHWTAPAWCLALATWLSIGLLAAYGAMNLQAAVDPAGGVAPRPGLRTRLLARCLRATRPASIMGVGAIFAISFDTLGQAGMLATAGASLLGPALAFALAGAFVAGMLATDGLNGWWVARLVARADADAARAARAMSASVGAISLGTAALGALARCSVRADAWIDGHGAWLALAVVAVLLGGVAAGRWRTGP